MLKLSSFEIPNLIKNGKYINAKAFVIRFIFNKNNGGVAVVAPKAVFKKAVERSKIKRILRQIVVDYNFNDLQMIIIAKKSICTTKFKDIQLDYKKNINIILNRI